MDLRHTFCGYFCFRACWLDRDQENPTASGSLWKDPLLGSLTLFHFSFTQPPEAPYFISIGSGHSMFPFASADFSGLWILLLLIQSYCASLMLPAIAYLSITDCKSPGSLYLSMKCYMIQWKEVLESDSAECTSAPPQTARWLLSSFCVPLSFRFILVELSSGFTIIS